MREGKALQDIKLGIHAFPTWRLRSLPFPHLAPFAVKGTTTKQAKKLSPGHFFPFLFVFPAAPKRGVGLTTAGQSRGDPSATLSLALGTERGQSCVAEAPGSLCTTGGRVRGGFAAGLDSLPAPGSSGATLGCLPGVRSRDPAVGAGRAGRGRRRGTRGARRSPELAPPAGTVPGPPGGGDGERDGGGGDPGGAQRGRSRPRAEGGRGEDGVWHWKRGQAPLPGLGVRLRGGGSPAGPARRAAAAAARHEPLPEQRLPT